MGLSKSVVLCNIAMQANNESELIYSCDKHYCNRTVFLFLRFYFLNLHIVVS